MKADATNSDAHERARMMIAWSDLEQPGFRFGAELSPAEQSWLAGHLESCFACREFAEGARQIIHSLRGIPVTASRSLVSATQMCLRERAEALQRQRQRLWVICVCCAAVTLSAAVSTLVLWRGFAWMGQQSWLSAPVWQMSFIAFYLTPAVLAGIFLLARGTYLADHTRSYLD